MTDYLELEKQYELGIYPKRDIVLVKGKNAKVWDQKGKEYIDCVAGNGVANVGHCNETIVNAITEQAKTLITCPGIFYNDTRARLLAKLINIAPGQMTKAFLCNSGTESVEAAIKFARFATGKTDIICCMRAFHGRTMGALSATFNPKYRTDFQPLIPGFQHVPFNNSDKLKNAITDRTAAVLVEIVQGEGGVNIGREDYLRQVQAICQDKGILLIIDEIQTGFCRTGKMFACEHFDLAPDMLCLAKGIAGGFPMGALLCSDKIEIPAGKHGSTFGGNPLACAAAIAAIDYMLDNELAEQARKKGTYFVKKLHEFDLPVIREVRHLGLMIGIELREKVKPFILKLLNSGVLVLPAGTTVLRLLPPLTISLEELNIVASEVARALKG
ncbi:MAG: acetylornithine/succinylornithine family transaminase [Calditrichaeota bacterium]|nr:acetylornithine/succinylornithine family transaminase [Calditrichota bacterium]